ncbi:MAG: uncharacterized protein KVP18_002306 [Porospora cf. gigantea A]|uniref:uncharacterized protein n=1 Tax=Porospora cf. gigantea A TaxID=2853593 RepID=UPI0035597C5E|nr:MAG: hypothetical protein KVP18_002306 [Porospora cf. gigantea A]
MARIYRTGRIVLVLKGKHAGKKGVVVQVEQKTRERKFNHALVVGIAKPPRRVTKTMSDEQIEKRLCTFPFIKRVNLAHLLPTRYTVDKDMDVKSLIPAAVDLAKPESKKEALQHIRKVLLEKFLNPTKAKTGEVSRDIVFLRRKLRF